MKAFVLSDVHGCYDPFIKLLEQWDKEMQLVILGDLIDRGDKSLGVVRHVMKLKDTYGDKVTVLEGNHEDLLLNFLNDPYGYGRMYDMVGGSDTIIDFVGNPSMMQKDILDISKTVQQCASREIDFIKKLPLYYEFGSVLFVHAGIDPLLADWRNTSEETYIWTRDMVHHKNETGLTVVFGHIPTQMLHDDTSNHGIWISKDKSYICVDGGCVFGGQLNAIVISDQGEVLEEYSV
ncbi:MAG: metallophosphoesterase family protein [Bacillus sp. (in: firmicutes)]